MGRREQEPTDDPEMQDRLECARRVGKAALDPAFRRVIPGGDEAHPAVVAAMLPRDELQRVFSALADGLDSGKPPVIHIALPGPDADDLVIARVQLVYMTGIEEVPQ